MYQCEIYSINGHMIYFNHFRILCIKMLFLLNESILLNNKYYPLLEKLQRESIQGDCFLNASTKVLYRNNNRTHF